MNGSIGKVVAAATAASLACEMPLPAIVDEAVAENPGGLGDDAFAEAIEAALGREIATDPGDLPQGFVHEGYLPESPNPDAPQGPRRPEREFPAN